MVDSALRGRVAGIASCHDAVVRETTRIGRRSDRRMVTASARRLRLSRQESMT